MTAPSRSQARQDVVSYSIFGNVCHIRGSLTCGAAVWPHRTAVRALQKVLSRCWARYASCEVSRKSGNAVLRVAYTSDVSAQDASTVNGLHSAQDHRASNLVGMALYACSSVFLTVQLSCAHYLGKSLRNIYPPIRCRSCKRPHS